ncbi:MAG: hypothetical protein AABX23_02340 [Nanoarchaeota archaeon]
MRRLLSLSLFFTVAFSFFVSAQSDVFPRTRDFFSGLYGNLIEPLFVFLLGPEVGPGNSEIFFAKILLFLVIVSVIWIILGRMPLFTHNRSTVGFVSIVVSLLGVRFISAEWVNAILLPYNTLGIAVVSVLPLAIYTYFVYSAIGSKTLQRAAWIVAGCVFIFLYWTRLDDLGTKVAWVYGLCAGACIITFFCNNIINMTLNKIKIESMYSEVNEKTKTHYRRELIQLEEDYRTGAITDQNFYDRQKAKIVRKIEDLT